MTMPPRVGRPSTERATTLVGEQAPGITQRRAARRRARSRVAPRCVALERSVAHASSTTSGAKTPVGGRRPPASSERRKTRSSSGVVGTRAPSALVTIRATTRVEIAYPSGSPSSFSVVCGDRRGALRRESRVRAFVSRAAASTTTAFPARTPAKNSRSAPVPSTASMKHTASLHAPFARQSTRAELSRCRRTAATRQIRVGRAAC